MGRSVSVSEAAGRMGRECISVRVRLINRVITALYDEALRPFGLRTSQVNILATVAHMDEARPAEVSRLLRIERSTLSRDLGLLKRNGWVESDPPAGGRNQTIRLTPEGEDLLVRSHPSWEKAQDEARRLIGEDGEATFVRLASRLGFEVPAP